MNASPAIELAAWKHASARFGSPAARSGSARRGRMVRCRRSRVPASTTWASDRVGCSVFLNNRYYDPTLGNFTTVVPLVGKTGTPYLYANGNPSTLSDPSGLCGVGVSASNEDAAALTRCVQAASGVPTGVQIPTIQFVGANGTHGGESSIYDSVSDLVTGRDIGDLGATVNWAASEFGGDAALIMSVGLIEQGYSGLCRRCMAAAEQNGAGLVSTHGITNISWEVFESAFSSNEDHLRRVLSGIGDRDAYDLWRNLGDEDLDSLAIAVTAIHLKERTDYFAGLDIDRSLGVSAAEFGALSWNFNKDTVTDIATGRRKFGPNTTDYVQTLRGYYGHDAFSYVCPLVADCVQPSSMKLA